MKTLHSHSHTHTLSKHWKTPNLCNKVYLNTTLIVEDGRHYDFFKIYIEFEKYVWESIQL